MTSLIPSGYGIAEIHSACKWHGSFSVQMRPVLESKNAAAIKEFTAVMYTSQLVAGTNYIIKVGKISSKEKKMLACL